MKLWIASDKDGTLFIYRSKPERVNEYVFDLADIIGTLNSGILPSVTWENSPQEVEIKLIEK